MALAYVDMSSVIEVQVNKVQHRGFAVRWGNPLLFLSFYVNRHRCAIPAGWVLSTIIVLIKRIQNTPIAGKNVRSSLNISGGRFDPLFSIRRTQKIKQCQLSRNMMGLSPF